MNRRDLIKNIFGIVPVTAATALVANAVTPSTPPIDTAPLPVTPWKPLHYYHGWDIWWTGWKSIPNQSEIAGQWIAYFDPKQYMLYSSWPGECGPFAPNSVFNIGIRDDQTLPRIFTPDNELRWMRAECLGRLYDLITQVGPPPYIPEWQR